MREKGFSLLELLIVVAIILIIAAIAIPNLLAARMSANEASAAGSLQQIKTAEYAYFDAYPSIGYAALSNLGGTGTPCVPSSSGACLIDNILATASPGSGSKSGYYLNATPAASTGASFNNMFVAAASPISVHETGNLDYCSTDDGVLRENYASVGDLPVTTTSACYIFPVAQ